MLYSNYIGGVLALGKENTAKINGFANVYWGWGQEDDDISARYVRTSINETTDSVVLQNPMKLSPIRSAEIERREFSHMLPFRRPLRLAGYPIHAFSGLRDRSRIRPEKAWISSYNCVTFDYWTFFSLCSPLKLFICFHKKNNFVLLRLVYY